MVIVIDNGRVSTTNPDELRGFIFIVIVAYDKVRGEIDTDKLGDDDIERYSELVDKVMDELFR